jgi:DtxR family Mn-dependent transcriptional regulator
MTIGHDVAHHPPVEEYLETVFHLEESQVPAMRARLVERLHVSAPAVSEQVRRLELQGYLVMRADRTLGLTESGRAYASAIVRRHRLAERLLVDVIGLPWHQVHAEAGRLEHAISPTLEARLVELLGDPATCPHGNPIPGSHRPADTRPSKPITEMLGVADLDVVRIEEELQADQSAMLALEMAGALPGARVSAVAGSAGSVAVTGPRGSVVLDARAAAAVLVSPGGHGRSQASGSASIP